LGVILNVMKDDMSHRPDYYHSTFLRYSLLERLERAYLSYGFQ